MARNRIWQFTPVLALALTAATAPAQAAPNPTSAIITVPCGMSGQNDGSQDCPKVNNGNGAKSGITVEFYSGGTLIYTEKDPTIYGGPGNNKTSEISILVTGNGSNFAAWYVDPQTSILNSPDLQVKVWEGSNLVLFSVYQPSGSALWSVHSVDTVDALKQIAAETARALAAEKSIGDDLAAERAARIAGDNALNTALNNEVTRAQGAEQALQTSVNGLQKSIADETAARMQADADNLAAAKAYTDAETAARQAGEAALTNNLNAEIARAKAAESAEVTRAQGVEATLTTNLANETQARTAADAALQASLTGEIAARQAADAAEATARSAADANLNAAIMAEAAARMAGDAAQKAYTDSRTPWPQSCLTGQVIVSTGNSTWTCDNICAGTITDVTSDPNNCSACGKVCALPNATSNCTSSVCTVKACAAGFSNCDNKDANGCEAYTAFDPNNCGGCGKVCGNGQICNAGVCGAPVTCSGSNVILVNQAGQLVNTPNDCGISPISRYGNGGNYGFTWNDNTPGPATAVKIEFQEGVLCNSPNAARTTSLNGTAGDNFTAGNAFCSCSPPSNAVIVMNNISNKAAYLKGAANTFLVTNAPATEGFYQSPNLNSSFARITVTYGTNNVNLDTDGQNCGGCGNACAIPNSVPTCQNGTCVLGQCNAGFADCDKNPANGCETSLNSDNANCGACGTACGGQTPVCNGGKCGNSIHNTIAWAGFQTANNACNMTGVNGVNIGNYQWLSMGAMTWKNCMLESSKRGAQTRAPTYGPWPQPGWFAHRQPPQTQPNLAMTGQWANYISADISTNQTCVLLVDPQSVSGGTRNTTSLNKTIAYDGNNWHYQDLGVMYIDQCELAAGNAGASIITPATLGLGDGNNYWFGILHTCSVYGWIITPGNNFAYDNTIARTSQKSCMVGFMDN